MKLRLRHLAVSSLVAVAACGHAKKPVAKGPVGPAPRDTSNDAAIIDAKAHSLIDGGAVSHVSMSVKDLGGGATQTADFLKVDDLRLIVSASCLHDGMLDCDAFEAVKRITGIKVEIGPGNPSTYYCEPAGGRNVVGTNPEGEAGLCRFPDGSMVDDWSFQYTPDLALGL